MTATEVSSLLSLPFFESPPILRRGLSVETDKGNEEEEMPIQNMSFGNALHLIIRLSCHYLNFTMINSFFHVSFAIFFSWFETSHYVLLHFDAMLDMVFVWLRHWHCHRAEHMSTE